MSSAAPALYAPEALLLQVPDGVSTGERLRRQDHATYERIVAGIAESLSTSAIARATGVARATIRAIRYGESHAESICHAKTRAKHHLARFIDAGSERIEDEVDDFALRDLPVAVAIAVDKLMLLDNAPTSIVEVRDGPSHEDLNDYLDRLRRVQPVGEVGNVGQKAVGDGVGERGEMGRQRISGEEQMAETERVSRSTPNNGLGAQ